MYGLPALSYNYINIHIQVSYINLIGYVNMKIIILLSWLRNLFHILTIFSWNSFVPFLTKALFKLSLLYCSLARDDKQESQSQGDFSKGYVQINWLLSIQKGNNMRIFTANPNPYNNCHRLGQMNWTLGYNYYH